MKWVPLLAGALLLAGCGRGDEPEPAPTGGASAAPSLGAGEARLPPQVAEFSALSSEDCAEVVRFYSGAIGSREFERAALVWDDPVVDAARLEAVFGQYRDARIEWSSPAVEGAAGSLFCTAAGTLTDAGDPAKAARTGELLLRRVNDVPGASPDQLRWTLVSSTFVETLERSQRGQP